MDRIKTTALVEGAIFAAITVVIGVIRFYAPFVAAIAIVWSVPTILIAFRHGFKVSINSAVVSSALVAIMTQPIEGLGFFIGFGLPGIIMGYLLKKKLSPGVTILITSIVLSVCSVASFYLGMLAIGVDIVKEYDKMFIDMKNAYSEAIDSISNIYGMMGVSRQEILKGTEAFEKSMEFMKLILPGGIFISGVILSFINFKLTRLVLKRINYFIEDVKPFSLWRLSRKGMISVMSLLLFMVAGMYLIKLPQLYTLTMNIFTLIMMLFAVLGLSVAKYFFDKYKFPKVLKGILMILLLTTLGNITMLVGVLDVPFDFRKLKDRPEAVS